MVFLYVTDETLGVYRNVMRVVGAWPKDAGKRESIIVFWVTFLVLLGDGSSVQQLLLTMIVVTQLLFRAYGNRMIPLIDSTIDDWSSAVDLDDRRIIKEHDKSGTYVWTFIVMFQAFGPMVKVTEAYVSFALGNSSEDYVLIRRSCALGLGSKWGPPIAVALMDISCIYGGILYFSNTLLFWSFAMQLSAQFEILRKRFREFLLIKRKIERRRVFRRLVDRHNQLLDLSGYLEDSFSHSMLLHVIFYQVLTCIRAADLLASVQRIESLEILRQCLSIGLCMLTLFLLYYAGDRLSTSCEEIGEELRKCNWYEIPKSSIIDFSIVIARSRRPKKLSVGNFYKLSLFNFRTVIESTYSYITCLISIQRKRY